MDDPTHDATIRKRRAAHGAIMLVGLLMTLLLAGAAFVVLENAALFKATIPSESPLEANDPYP